MVTLTILTKVVYFTLQLIGTAKICYASEKSEVNPQHRQMTLKTRNLSFCRYIAVDETVKYTPHPTDPAKTLLTQEAVVTVQVSIFHGEKERELLNLSPLVNNNNNHCNAFVIFNEFSFLFLKNTCGIHILIICVQ